MQFRLVQVVGDFEHHRNLGGQGAGPANILLRNAGVIETIEHSEHAEHFSVGAEQGDREQLPGLVLRDHLQIRAGQLGEIVGPENFFFPQGAGGDALRENGIDAPRLALE